MARSPFCTRLRGAQCCGHRGDGDAAVAQQVVKLGAEKYLIFVESRRKNGVLMPARRSNVAHQEIARRRRSEPIREAMFVVMHTASEPIDAEQPSVLREADIADQPCETVAAEPLDDPWLCKRACAGCAPGAPKPRASLHVARGQRLDQLLPYHRKLMDMLMAINVCRRAPHRQLEAVQLLVNFRAQRATVVGGEHRRSQQSRKRLTYARIEWPLGQVEMHPDVQGARIEVPQFSGALDPRGAGGHAAHCADPSPRREMDHSFVDAGVQSEVIDADCEFARNIAGIVQLSPSLKANLP